MGQLALNVLSENLLDETDFIETMKEMVKDKSIVLEEPSYEIESVLDYFLTLSLSGWLWLTLGVTTLAMAMILVPGILPLVVLRWVLGSALVLYLPGYSVLQLLFPKGSEVASLERFALSVGVSLAIVPLIALMLGLTPWGITLPSVTSTLGAFVYISALAAGARRYTTIRKST